MPRTGRLRWPLTHLVGVVWQQDVARGQISGVQIEDVGREPPTRAPEARDLGPRGIGDEQRIGADVEGRLLRAKIVAPHPARCARAGDFHPARTQPCRAREVAGARRAAADLIFEIDDDDVVKFSLTRVPASHRSAKQSRMILPLDHAAGERHAYQLVKRLRRPFRLGNASGLAS